VLSRRGVFSRECENLGGGEAYRKDQAAAGKKERERRVRNQRRRRRRRRLLRDSRCPREPRASRVCLCGSIGTHSVDISCVRESGDAARNPVPRSSQRATRIPIGQCEVGRASWSARRQGPFGTARYGRRTAASSYTRLSSWTRDSAETEKPSRVKTREKERESAGGPGNAINHRDLSVVATRKRRTRGARETGTTRDAGRKERESVRARLCVRVVRVCALESRRADLRER